MPRPDPYLFAISHYRDKTRWALDYPGIPQRLKYLMPGPHIEAAKKLGAGSSSLPKLSVDGERAQGCGAIVNWAEQQAAPRTLTPGSCRADCLAPEQRMDGADGLFPESVIGWIRNRYAQYR